MRRGKEEEDEISKSGVKERKGRYEEERGERHGGGSEELM